MNTNPNPISRDDAFHKRLRQEKLRAFIAGGLSVIKGNSESPIISVPALKFQAVERQSHHYFLHGIKGDMRNSCAHVATAIHHTQS